MKVKDWVSEAAVTIAKRVLHGGADRSDIIHIERAIEEHCPFKRGVLYQEIGAGIVLEESAALTCKPGKDTITLLPAIKGHAHMIGSDGQPSCGCAYLKAR